MTRNCAFQVGYFFIYSLSCTVERGGRGLGTKFQPLMLSPNLLKSQSPITVVVGGGGGGKFPTFDAESKFAKIFKKFTRGFAENFLSLARWFKKAWVTTNGSRIRSISEPQSTNGLLCHVMLWQL